MEPDLVADLLEHTMREVSSGDVHHAVEPSEIAGRLRNRFIHRRPVSDVDDQGEMRTRALGQTSDDLLGRVEVQIGDRYPCAFLRQAGGAGPTDAMACAGH